MILQSNSAWLPSRVGHATGSHANDILDFRKDGKPGAKHIQYIADLVTERATSRAVDRPVNKWMIRGQELEPQARSAYEDETGILVQPAAFILHPTIEYAGATPDGFIGRDGLLEIKVPAPQTFVRWRMAGEIPEEHVAQMTFQLAVTKRQWVDFCAWCPEVEPRLQLFIRRFEPDPAEVAALESKVKEFLHNVEQAFQAYSLTDPVAA